MNDITNAIYMREKLPHNMLILSSFLKVYGVPGFENKCIKEMLTRIDMEHVCVQFSNKEGVEIFVDEIGISDNEDILNIYIYEEVLAKAIDYLHARNALIDSHNEFFDILQNTSADTLKTILNNPYTYFPPERVERNCKMFAAELEARKLSKKFLRKIKKGLSNCRKYILKNVLVHAVLSNNKLNVIDMEEQNV